MSTSLHGFVIFENFPRLAHERKKKKPLMECSSQFLGGLVLEFPHKNNANHEQLMTLILLQTVFSGSALLRLLEAPWPVFCFPRRI